MDYKEFAMDLAFKAGSVMKHNFSVGMKREWKNDHTPLTETDTSINKLVIDSIQNNFPNHSIVGEEASAEIQSDYVWVCDPVDGTTAFSHAYPTFMFSLALVHNGESILGTAYDPILNRLFIAEKGKGSFLNGKKIEVSKNTVLDRSLVNIDIDGNFYGLRDLLIKKGALVPTLYSSVYAGSLIAAGEFVGEIYAHDKPWDGAALKIIIEEAGGKVTDLNGNEQRYDKTINGFVATNGSLHLEILELIRQASS